MRIILVHKGRRIKMMMIMRCGVSVMSFFFKQNLIYKLRKKDDGIISLLEDLREENLKY